MLTSGDVVDLDLGVPEGREAGFRHPAVIITSQAVLDQTPNVVHVVPLTSNVRGLGPEVTVEPDADVGIDTISAAQCQHLRAVSTHRIMGARGGVGPVALGQIREVVALLLDLP